MSDRAVYVLADVLATLPLPLGPQGLTNVSRKWRCVMAPRVTSGGGGGEAEEVALRTLDRGASPVFLHPDAAKPAADAAGPDALAFVCDPRWNRFPKPQIAVRGGWGRPGTTLESSEYHKLIAAFDEVFIHKPAAEMPMSDEERAKLREAQAAAAAEEQAAQEAEEAHDAGARFERSTPTVVAETDEEVLEMQLFHRDDPATCPQLPPLGNELRWPSFLDGASAVICDVDTVVSERGARRWWRLHDGGELVLQAALPLPAVPHTLPPTAPPSAKLLEALYGRRLEAQSAKPVRLLIFGPKGSYDWFVHDDESTVRGRISCLDLLDTPDEALPVDATLLPVLTVAVLEAGGAPLLIPPNLPCMTFTLNNSVVVEQRRISHTLWLDEVSYFLSRTAHWASNPLIYDFIEKDLQDEAFVSGELVPGLMELWRRHDGHNPYEETVRRRVAASLYAIAANEKHFALSQGSRASLKAHLLGSGNEMAVVLNAPDRPPYCILGPGTQTFEQALQRYWDVKACWPRAGCVFKPPLLASDVTHYSTSAREAGGELHIPVIYCGHRPIFGTERQTLQDTVGEYFEMKELERRRQPLLAYLRSRKEAKDDLLDELF